MLNCISLVFKRASPMETNFKKMYEQLGFLFYAISAADKIVKPAEIEKLRELVNQYWVPMEGTVDEFATNAAEHILIVFDYLVQQKESAREAFRSFAKYYEENPDVFSCPIKHRISDTAGSIAHAFGNINKAEKGYLTQLHALLTDDELVNQVHG